MSYECGSCKLGVFIPPICKRIAYGVCGVPRKRLDGIECFKASPPFRNRAELGVEIFKCSEQLHLVLLQLGERRCKVGRGEWTKGEAEREPIEADSIGIKYFRSPRIRSKPQHLIIDIYGNGLAGF